MSYIKAIAIIFMLSVIGCTYDTADDIMLETGSCLVEINGDFVEQALDILPEYLEGGMGGFHSALLKVLKYPSYARENNIQGQVILHYEISKIGKVENIVIIEEPGGGIGDAAVSALTAVTSGVCYSPAILNGEAVRVRKSLPLIFVIQ